MQRSASLPPILVLLNMEFFRWRMAFLRVPPTGHTPMWWKRDVGEVGAATAITLRLTRKIRYASIVVVARNMLQPRAPAAPYRLDRGIPTCSRVGGGAVTAVTSRMAAQTMTPSASIAGVVQSTRQARVLEGHCRREVAGTYGLKPARSHRQNW